MNSSAGWVKIYRSITNWDWYKDSKTKSLFIHLLIMANHKDGFFQGIPVKRGQYLTGRKILSNDLGLSEQEIRTSLSRLQKSGNINQQPTSKNTLITVMKYDDFQAGNQQSTNETSDDQPAINQPSTSHQPAFNHKQECNNSIMEECKEEKKVQDNSLVDPAESIKKETEQQDQPKLKKKRRSPTKYNYPPEFDLLWLDFLKDNRPGDDKQSSCEAYKLCIVEGLSNDDIAHGLNYLAKLNGPREDKYKKSMSNWLNVGNVKSVLDGHVICPSSQKTDLQKSFDRIDAMYANMPDDESTAENEDQPIFKGLLK